MATNEIGGNTRKEYNDSVKRVAEEAINADDIGDYIHESVDGNYWVIYTHAAYAVWMFSDNEGAIDDAVDEGIYDYAQAKSFSDILSAMAFFAMKRDAEEAVAELEDED